MSYLTDLYIARRAYCNKYVKESIAPFDWGHFVRWLLYTRRHKALYVFALFVQQHYEQLDEQEAGESLKALEVEAGDGANPMRAESAIINMIHRVKDDGLVASGHPTLSFEDGVAAALEWVLCQIDDPITDVVKLTDGGEL